MNFLVNIFYLLVKRSAGYLCFVFLLFSANANAKMLGAEDVPEIRSAYKDNRALFNIKFKGKPIALSGLFYSIDEDQGIYLVTLLSEHGYVQCLVERPTRKITNLLASLSRDEKISIKGSVFLAVDTSPPILSIEYCSILK